MASKKKVFVSCGFTHYFLKKKERKWTSHVDSAGRVTHKSLRIPQITDRPIGGYKHNYKICITVEEIK